MNRVRVIIFAFIVFCIGVNNVFSECNDDEFNRLKDIASNIEIRYEYIGDDDDLNELGNYMLIYDNYSSDIIISGSGDDDFYFDSKLLNNNAFNYIFSNSGKVKIKMFASSLECSGRVLNSVDLKLKRKNMFYNSNECKNVNKKNVDLEVCHEFVDNDSKINNMSHEEFLNIVDKYIDYDDEEDILFGIKNFILGNRLLVFTILGICLICVVLLISRRNKRSVLE